MTAIEINAVIDNLSQKLCVPTGKMLELLPALGVREAASFLITFVIFCALLYISYQCCKHGTACRAKINKALENGDCDAANRYDAQGKVMAVIGFCAVVGAVFSFYGLASTLSNLILWFYNPQAWALGYVLDKLK